MSRERCCPQEARQGTCCPTGLEGPQRLLYRDLVGDMQLLRPPSISQHMAPGEKGICATGSKLLLSLWSIFLENDSNL